MTSHPLAPLFEAQSVAVIGASAEPTKIGGRPLAMLQANGFAGVVHPVNPRGGEIQGLAAATSIAKVEGPVDLAICAVPSAAVADTLRQCADKGVRGVVIFSSGFAEIGDEGERQQAAMSALAADSGMRLMGPNCMGFANFRRGLIASFHPGFATPMGRDGRIGLVSQSGAFGGLCAVMAMQRGVPMSHVLTTGNESDVQAADCLGYLAQDPDTDVILCYLEGCRDGPRLLEALALARENRKPVVAVKLGRTEAGARAAASHTAALAGSDAVYDALFRQFGVHRAHSIEEFFDIGCAIAVGGLPADDKVGIVTVSGGVGVLMADAAAGLGLDVAPLPDAAQRQMKEMVPFAGVNNPLDVTGQVVNDPELFGRAMRLVMEQADYAAIAAFQGSQFAAEGAMEKYFPPWQALKAAWPERLFAVAGMLTPQVQQAFQAIGIPAVVEPTHAIRAIAAGAGFTAAFARPEPWQRAAQVDVALPTGPVDELAALALLRAAGVPAVEAGLARDRDQAVAMAAALDGPVVLKVVSPDILHKTEVGGVRLNLKGADAVAAAFDAIIAAAGVAAPEAEIHGCLVAPMAGEGVETIIGVVRDPVFGPVVMFGLGGVFVEALQDVTFRVAPFGEAEAARMLDEVRGARLLDGVRGRPPADRAALASALAALSRLAAAHAGRIRSIEANPFLVRAEGAGALALDAVVELDPDGEGDGT